MRQDVAGGTPKDYRRVIENVETFYKQVLIPALGELEPAAQCQVRPRHAEVPREVAGDSWNIVGISNEGRRIQPLTARRIGVLKPEGLPRYHFGSQPVCNAVGRLGSGGPPLPQAPLKLHS